MSKIDIAFPADKKEQQKIASCLSSLDELIAAHTKKHEALQSYKRGLMQNLFPAEGKTVPVLRFPDFRAKNAWQREKLSELAKRITIKNRAGDISRVLTNSAMNGVMDQRAYFDKDIAVQGNLSGYYVVEVGDYVYNPRKSNMAPVGPISKNKIDAGVVSPLYTVFRFKNKNTNFYEQYFKSKCWHQYLRQMSNSGARHDRMNISSADFDDMPLPVPSTKEQQKIADCLSSLDDLIGRTSEKIEALKAHKKGLMQQLFPAMDEVAA